MFNCNNNNIVMIIIDFAQNFTYCISSAVFMSHVWIHKKTSGLVSQKLHGRWAKRPQEECWTHPHPRQSSSMGEGWRGKMVNCRTFRCSGLMVVRGCRRAGDRQGAVVVKWRDACWGLRLIVQWGGVQLLKGPESQTDTGLLLPPRLPLSLSLNRAFLTELWRSTLREMTQQHQIKMTLYVINE